MALDIIYGTICRDNLGKRRCLKFVWCRYPQILQISFCNLTSTMSWTDDDEADEQWQSRNKEGIGKGTPKHFRWTKPMSDTLIGLLAREAVNGNKLSTTFKKKSLTKVAKEIKWKFFLDCRPNHIVNHLKTVKKDWETIAALRNKSGFGWDDNLKMIIVDDDTYKREMLANPINEKYLNKTIEMYSEMALVFGKGIANGGDDKEYIEVDSSMKDVNDDDSTSENSEDANAGTLALTETPKHFRWSRQMSNTLIGLLAREAAKGNRTASSNFQKKSLVKVAKEIREKFAFDIQPNHIVNHLRTVKKDWVAITTLRSKSGFGWDDNLKMIIVDDNTYKREILANPNNEKYLNKKIEMYLEMNLVFGKRVRVATRSNAKSSPSPDVYKEYSDADSGTKDVDDNDDWIEEKAAASSSIHVSEKQPHRKRRRDSEDANAGMLALAAGVELVGQALLNLTKDRLVVKDLYYEVMKMEGYSEKILGKVFDYLVEHEMQAKGFMVKSENLRKMWIDSFLRKSGRTS